MLGLHQTHQSYSPASVAAAAAVGRGGDRSSKTSKLAGGRGGPTSGRTTVGGAGDNSHRRQQLVMEEENSIQTVRVHPIREDKHQRHQTSHSRIVRVPPRTAEPLVIGSMPNCASGGGGRAATRESRSKQHQDYGVREHHYHQQETTRAHQGEESRHFLLRQQQRQLEADNQVVLIMSDTSGLGASGIPIIGRRLPSKSHPAPQPPRSAHQLEYIEPEGMSVHAPGAQHQQQPVIGRRSHRVAQRQQHQLHHEQESMRRQSVRQHATQCQPLSIIETQSPMSERVIRAAQVRHLEYSHHDGHRRCPSLSVLDSHKHNYDEVFDQQPARSTRRVAPMAPTKTTSDRRASSKNGPSRLSSSVLCTDPCCLQAAPASAPGQSCVMPCCNPLVSANSFNESNSPLSRQATSQQHMKRAARRRESARDDLAAYMKPAHAANSNLLSTACSACPFPADGGASRTRRSSSLSRGDHLAPAAARDRRSSRLLMEAVSGSGGHLAYNSRMGRHQPTTPPPVPSKPNSHQHHHLLMLHHQQVQQDDDSAAVTQMYESLAAELKAKLGNPNRAPILLPPKDYDTLSRQQGKLTGIELRRSTNPQLVGPHTSCCSNAETNQSQNQAVETGGEARTASQKPPTGEPACLQRSRSNSSSGLGSISLSASSPDEHADVAFTSPSRSSCSGASNSPSGGQSCETTTTTGHYYEQIRHGRTCEEEEEKKARTKGTDTRRGKGIENHNPSKVSDGILWNGRIEIPLKVNSERRNGNTYLATKQIIY